MSSACTSSSEDKEVLKVLHGVGVDSQQIIDIDMKFSEAMVRLEYASCKANDAVVYQKICLILALFAGHSPCT